MITTFQNIRYPFCTNTSRKIQLTTSESASERPSCLSTYSPTMSSNHDKGGSGSLRKEIALAMKTHSPLKHALVEGAIENVDHPTPNTAKFMVDYQTIKQGDEVSSPAKRRMLEVASKLYVASTPTARRSLSTSLSASIPDRSQPCINIPPSVEPASVPLAPDVNSPAVLAEQHSGASLVPRKPTRCQRFANILEAEQWIGPDRAVSKTNPKKGCKFYKCKRERCPFRAESRLVSVGGLDTYRAAIYEEHDNHVIATNYTTEDRGLPPAIKQHILNMGRTHKALKPKVTWLQCTKHFETDPELKHLFAANHERTLMSTKIKNFMKSATYKKEVKGVLSGSKPIEGERGR